MDKFCKICFEKIKFSFLRSIIESNYSICDSCKNKIKIDISTSIIENTKVTFLSTYSGLLKQAIINYKEFLDYELKDIFLYFFIPYIKLHFHNYIFVPIPSAQSKIQERKFSHLEEMLEPYKINYISALEKNNTNQQKELNLHNRINSSNIFLNIKANLLRNKKIVLFDDIYTTGSSFLSSLKEIKKISPSNIQGLILMKNNFKID